MPYEFFTASADGGLRFNRRTYQPNIFFAMIMFGIPVYALLYLALGFIVGKPQVFQSYPMLNDIGFVCVLFSPLFLPVTLVVLQRIFIQFTLYPAQRHIVRVAWFGLSKKVYSFDGFDGFHIGVVIHGFSKFRNLFIKLNYNGSLKKIVVMQNSTEAEEQSITSELQRIIDSGASHEQTMTQSVTTSTF